MAKQRRRTLQKGLIRELLGAATGHVSADDLFTRARLRLPRISLGTVYRNLKLLRDEGDAAEVVGPGGRSLWSLGREPHHHVRCLSCGRVADVDLVGDLETSIGRQASAVSGFVVKGVSIEVAGFCPVCQGTLGRPTDRG